MKTTTPIWSFALALAAAGCGAPAVRLQPIATGPAVEEPRGATPAAPAEIGRPIGEVAAAGPAAMPATSPARRGFFHAPLAAWAEHNQLYRDVVFTSDRQQIAVMSLHPGDDIGEESHGRVEQIIVCVDGTGEATLDGRATTFHAGDVLVIPPGVQHDVRNVGGSALKLYTIYAPPNHIAGRRHATKQDAEADKADQAFGEHAGD